MKQEPHPRPLALREKLMVMGAEQLSDEELLTVFIGSGNKNKSCRELARQILDHFGDLRQLMRAELKQLQAISGFGQVRFVKLKAAYEMIRRSDEIQLKSQQQFSNSEQTYRFLKQRLRDKKQEVFAAIFLDNQHRYLHYEELFYGTINAASVYTRPVVEKVLQHNAAALILAHNHPSGHCIASEQDIAVTERMQQALSLVDACLLDHLVIGDNEVYSIFSEMRFHCV